MFSIGNAYRTTPRGFSTDKQHICISSIPIGRARPYQRSNGKTVWIECPEDEGESVEIKIPAPITSVGEKVSPLDRDPIAEHFLKTMSDVMSNLGIELHQASSQLAKSLKEKDRTKILCCLGTRIK